MKNTNKISGSLTPEQIQNLSSQLEQITNDLDFQVDLSPEDRQSLVKLGPALLPFSLEIQQMMEVYPESLTAEISKQEYDNDLLLYNDAEKLLVLVRRLHERLEEIKIVAGSDVIKTAYQAYGMFKLSARGNPTIDANLKHLARHLKKGKRKEDDQAETSE